MKLSNLHNAFVMNLSKWSLLLLALTLMLHVFPVDAAKQPVGTVFFVTPELLASKIKETEANTSLEESIKASLLKNYHKAQSAIDATRNFNAGFKKFSENQQQVLEETEALRHALSKSLPAVTKVLVGIKENTTLAQLEQLRLKLQATRSNQQSSLAEMDDQLERQVTRPSQIHQRLAEAKRELEEVSNSLAGVSQAGQLPALVEAREWALTLTRERLDAEIRLLDQELLTQPGRMELLQLKRDGLVRELGVSNQKIALLQELIGSLRKAEASQDQAEAEAVQKDVKGKHPLLRGLAEENAQLSRSILSAAEELSRLNGLIEEQRRRFELYESDFKSARQKLELAGLSPTLGRVLMRQRRQLDEIKREKVRNRDLEKITVTVSLRQIGNNEQRRKVGDPAKAVDHYLQQQPEQLKSQLRPETETLLKNRRELLDKAIALDSNLLRRLVELDFAERQLVELITNYDLFLAENLLWIRSVTPIDISMLAQLPQEMTQLLSPTNLGGIAKAIFTASSNGPVLFIGVPLVLVLLWLAPALQRKVIRSGKCVNDLVRDRFQHTTKALAYQFLRALSWPLLFALVGWHLSGVSDGGEYVRETGRYLILASPVFFILRFFWLLCEPKGIAQMHFDWTKAAAHRLHHQTNLLMLTLLPAALVVMLANTQSVGSEYLGLSRLAFLFMMLSISFYFYQLFRSKSEVIHYLNQYYPGGLLIRSRGIWYPMAVSAPVVLAMLSLFGYFYTAGVLTRSLVNSLLMVLAVIVLYEVVIRWLLVKLKVARRAAAAERIKARASEAEQLSGEIIESLPPVEAESKLDLAAIDTDTRKLITILVQLLLLVGFWLIWSSVFPAFAGLDGISLWQQTVTVGGEKEIQAITLQHLVTAIIVAIVTAVVAKSLPSLLNIIMMQQLSVKKGTRYAYETLTRYLVIGIGLVVIFSSVGGSWSEIQWLVAALGVGIGFGLQEIVANFISGLIILFERPIRVGDVVTVGDVSGVVSKIRIRATTITNWDRQELLVPNKEFITGRLLNWSLSDSVIRSTIDVGIDYGSDVDKALSLLEEVAAEHERVLADPAPLITFDNFGDSALNLKMRFYLPSIDNRVRTLSEMHQMINSKFIAAGIGISFPQQDVHLDTLRPLEINIRKEKR